jgi:hypothetical protein
LDGGRAETKTTFYKMWFFDVVWDGGDLSKARSKAG